MRATNFPCDGKVTDHPLKMPDATSPPQRTETADPQRPNFVRRMYDWVLSLAERKHAGSWLAGLSFAEASFFPIPPDVLLIPLCLGSARRALRFATLCTVASVVGGAFGYFIGAQLWSNLDTVFYDWIPGFTESKFHQFQGWYEEWGIWIVFAAGFSPLPYKIFTITSGVASMAFLPFLAISAVSRGARFFLVAGLLARYGEPMKQWIDRYFNLLALLFTVLLLAGFASIRWLG